MNPSAGLPSISLLAEKSQRRENALRKNNFGRMKIYDFTQKVP
jgi:hypothetical protein